MGLTGSSGYVGGRLLRALEARGERVRCLSRRPEVPAGRVGAGTEVVLGDVLLPATLAAFLEGVEDGGGSTIQQTAIFDPGGAFGLAYWYGLWPIHTAIFASMLPRLAQAAGGSARGKASDVAEPDVRRARRRSGSRSLRRACE